MNHETHEKHENRTPHRLRLPSPLSPDEEEIVTRVIGCAIDVHKTLGPGFLESIYKKAMCVELQACGLPFELERSVTVKYRDVEIHGTR